jgi:hypothetical protein
VVHRKKATGKPRWVKEKYPPIGLESCVVPYDAHSGCAVSVERNLTGELSLIGLTFVTEYDQTLPSDLSLPQAEALVVAVSEVIRQARAGG